MEKSQTAENMAAHQRILHQPSSNLTADYWKSEHDGLVSDGTPWLDLKRLQTEITKVISLRETDPMAMLSLLEYGAAEFELPEFLFDEDYPGHYCISLGVPVQHLSSTHKA